MLTGERWVGLQKIRKEIHVMGVVKEAKKWKKKKMIYAKK